MSKSKIEWTEFSWNPIRGCSRKGPGCENCFAERDAARKNENPKLPGYKGFATFTPAGPRWTGRVELIEHKLDEPLRRKKPTTWFVNSMADLWHEKLDFRDIIRPYGVMAACYWHKFIVLTKRSQRRLEGFNRRIFHPEVVQQAFEWTRDRLGGSRDARTFKEPPWPLPNVIEGVSTSTQEDADRDIPILLQTPAALRLVSAEPLLEAVDFSDWLGRDFLGGTNNGKGVGWLIAGGESGPGARPSHPDWFRSARDQCVAAGVPFFFKQWGEFCEWDQLPDDVVRELDANGEVAREAPYRVGKKAAGRLLDGRTWDEMPEVNCR